MFNIYRVLKGIQFWKPTLCQFNNATVSRNFADTPTQNVPPKQVQGTESEKRVRVRRARPGDVPRVLLFVRDHARAACPGMTPVPVAGVVMSDYVARALAQGHSMLAEQQESRRGLYQIRGLALTTATSPWDAGMLERWARCLKCPRSRQMLAYTAHCLRAPALHDKYRVHKIMQVHLIVPHELQKNTEIVKILTKHVINRGRDVGCPLLRFDVTSTPVVCQRARRSGTLLAVRHKLAKSEQSVYVCGPQIYNHLPKEVKRAKSLAEFKRHLKKWLTEQTFYTVTEFIDRKM